MPGAPSARDTVAVARTLLFVPGHRPERFDKAARSGSDAVVLDLEDAVGPGDKRQAREHVRSWLDSERDAVVRINGAETEWHEDDIAMVSGRATAIMIPKAEDLAELEALAKRLPSDTAIIPLIETAQGVLRAPDICAAPGVARPAFGSVDLAAQLGIDHQSHEGLRHARSVLALATAAAGCAAPVDGVTTVLHDEAVLQHDIDHAQSHGFTGKLCIHPKQVDLANESFLPSNQDLEWARSIVAATTDDSVSVHNGQMIDRPVILRARAILARATPSQ